MAVSAHGRPVPVFSLSDYQERTPKTERQRAVEEIAEVLGIPPSEVFPTETLPTEQLRRMAHPYGRRATQ